MILKNLNSKIVGAIQAHTTVSGLRQFPSELTKGSAAFKFTPN